MIILKQVQLLLFQSQLEMIIHLLDGTLELMVKVQHMIMILLMLLIKIQQYMLSGLKKKLISHLLKMVVVMLMI